MVYKKPIPLSTHTPRAEAFSLAYCGVTVSIGARVDAFLRNDDKNKIMKTSYKTSPVFKTCEVYPGTKTTNSFPGKKSVRQDFHLSPKNLIFVHLKSNKKE